MALVGSISIAKRFSKPFTFVASLENFCPNASERLCAGSVDCVVVGMRARARACVREMNAIVYANSFTHDK